MVEGYHRHVRARLPNMAAHASLYVIVENQAALGDEIPVQRILDRLMQEGIDRHKAIHAARCWASICLTLLATRLHKLTQTPGLFAARVL